MPVASPPVGARPLPNTSPPVGAIPVSRRHPQSSPVSDDGRGLAGAGSVSADGKRQMLSRNLNGTCKLNVYLTQIYFYTPDIIQTNG